MDHIQDFAIISSIEGEREKWSYIYDHFLPILEALMELETTKQPAYHLFDMKKTLRTKILQFQPQQMVN